MTKSAAAASRNAGATRDLIIETAAQLFATHSFDRTTTRMIASALRLNVATIYYHFADKEALYFWVLHDALSTLTERAADAVDAAGAKAGDQLAAFVRAHVTFQLERVGIASLYSMRNYILKRDATDHLDRLRRIEKSHYRRLRRIIDRGVRSKDFAVGSPALCTFAIFAIGEHAPTWYREGGKLSVERVADLYADMAKRLVAGKR